MTETMRAAAITENPLIMKNPLIRRLNDLMFELDLDHRDFVIFGSGPLLAHGLRSDIGDLDVVARGTTWRRVSKHRELSTADISRAPMAVFEGEGGRIQFYPGWISPEWDPDDLIDRAENIQGLPFAQLTDVLAYKQTLRRHKDGPDIAALLDRLCPALRAQP